jgi:hypothetical protein
MKRPREPELKFPYMIPPHMIGNRIMVIEVDPWKMSVADTLRRDLKRLKEEDQFSRSPLSCLYGPCLGCSGFGLRSCTGLAVSLVLHNATGTTGVAENWVELIERR